MKPAAFALVVLAVALGDLNGLHAQRQGGATRGGQGQGRGGIVRDTGIGPATAPTGTAIISGRITAVDTGLPVRGAQVRALSRQSGPPRTTTTNDEGWFELRDLPAGRWTLGASKSGFVPREFGQRAASAAGSSFELKDGQRFSADMALFRGGAIGGRLYDEFGEPAAGVRVQALRSQFLDGRRQLLPTGVADQTDDTGTFRVYGLPPGDYYVSARAEGGFIIDAPDGMVFSAAAELRSRVEAGVFMGGPNMVIGRQNNRPSAPTYFPGTANISEAQRISLSPGQEHIGLSFPLVSVPTVRVSGTVIDSVGEPATGRVMVSLVANAGDVTAGGMATGVRGEGAFELANVAPGSYTLRVTSIGSRGADGESAAVPVTVGAEDVSGLTVVTAPAATLSGRVIGDGGARPRTNGMLVRAHSLGGGPNGTRAGGAVIDGAFRFGGLLGPFRIEAERVPDGWSLKSVAIDGFDVTDTPVEFRPGQHVTATIVLTDRVTELSGSVTVDGNLAPETDVLVFADDVTKWAFPSRYVRTLRASDRGAYSARGLPPFDRYLAVAVEYLEQGEAQDPDFLERIRSRATPFSLDDGETKRLDLRLWQRD